MTLAPSTGDPRASRLDDHDIRPAVRTPRRGLPPLVIAIVALLAAVMLFSVLEARRRSLEAPAVAMPVANLPGSDAPPPLVLPPAPLPPVDGRQFEAALPPIPQPPPQPAIVRTPPPVYPTQPASAPVPGPAPQRVSGGQALVIDSETTGPNAPSPNTASTSRIDRFQTDGGVAPRAHASVIANRAMTVAQGTIIPAVLETAFNSTQPGFARALVQRDVRGFDGSQILIPRGSRLIGEYATEAAPGQGRAMIAWSRLIRPDGVSIAIGSPAADPVGRGGIKAKVNSHFFARFSGAILQSALDVGVNLASRRNDTSVVVALPGSVGNTTSQLVRPTQIVPTLSVAQGTSVSVFVARDLDFSGADAAP